MSETDELIKDLYNLLKSVLTGVDVHDMSEFAQRTIKRAKQYLGIKE